MDFLPVVVAVLAGCGFGLLRGGRLWNLSRVRLHSPMLALVAIGSGMALDHWSVATPRLVALVGISAAIALAWRNIHLAGMMILAIGITTNLLPVMLNGAVPVRAEALTEAQMVDPGQLSQVELSGSREFADGSTLLADLGDTIPVRPTHQVMSYGDLIILVAVADVIANGMRRRRRPRYQGAISSTRPDHDWGTAPSPRPVSPSQYSARADEVTPRIIDLANSAAIPDPEGVPEPASAVHSR